MAGSRHNIKRHKDPGAGKATSGDLDLGASVKEPAALLRRAFEADAAKFQGKSPDLAAVFGYWIGYPSFLGWIGFGRDWGAHQDTVLAYYALNHVHGEATRVLMKEATRRGMDPHALYECSRVVQEIYLAAPELCVRRTGAIHDGWPECMGAARYSLPAGQQEALRAGEAVFIRLAVAMDIARAAPALTPDDSSILEALSGAKTTLVQVDIAAAAERDIKTIRERLKRLEDDGLISRPRGERSGYAITPAGLGLLSSSAR